MHIHEINENFKNERKIVEKLRGIPTKLPISHLLCVQGIKLGTKSILGHCTFTLWSDRKNI